MLQLAKKSYALQNGTRVVFDMKLPLGRPAADFPEWAALGHMMITMTAGPPTLNEALPSTPEELEISLCKLEFTHTMTGAYQANRPLSELWDSEEDLKAAVAGPTGLVGSCRAHGLELSDRERGGSTNSRQEVSPTQKTGKGDWLLC